MQKLLTMLVVFVGLMINADKSFGEKIEIDVDKLITASVDQKLIDDASVKPNAGEAVTNIVDGLKDRLGKYLSTSDVETVQNKVKDSLTSMLKGANDTNAIKAVLKIDNVKAFLGSAVKEALVKDKVSEKIDALEEKVDMLNAGIRPKIIRPNKEVEFLYDLVINGSYEFKNSNNKIIRIEDYHFVNELESYFLVGLFWGKTFATERAACQQAVQVVPTQPITPQLRRLTEGEMIKYKLLAVEEVLGLPCNEACNCNSGEGKDIIPRINRAQKKIRNYDWERDHLRFALMASYINDIDAIATSLILHAYPSYRRFIPGQIDLFRRTSFFFGLGTSGTNIKDSDIEGPIYSYGIGFDIREGIGLTVGGSTYTIKDSTNDSEDVKTNWTAGVTLTSELWKALFNGK